MSKNRDLSLLHKLLGMRRVSGSSTEHRALLDVVFEIEHHFKGKQNTTVRMQHIPTVGLEVQVGDKPTVLFTSHLDTVHRQEGAQEIFIDEIGLCFAENGDGTPSVLGADDAAGVFLMVEMIKAKRPGLYMFFLCEERGGIASSEYADCYCPSGLKQCISFDRRGYSDVITHQASGRCCSDEYATALADALSKRFGTKHLVGYHPSDAGIFTDSANFVDVIPECTNISVGYFCEHTVNEYLDTSFLCDLADVLCKLNFNKLPIKRDPMGVDIDDYRSWENYSEEDYIHNFLASHVQLDIEAAEELKNTAALILGTYNLDEVPETITDFVETVYELLEKKLR